MGGVEGDRRTGEQKKTRKIRRGIEDMNKIDGMFKVKLGYEDKMRRLSERGVGGGGTLRGYRLWSWRGNERKRKKKVMEGLNLTVR